MPKIEDWHSRKFGYENQGKDLDKKIKEAFSARALIPLRQLGKMLGIPYSLLQASYQNGSLKIKKGVRPFVTSEAWLVEWLTIPDNTAVEPLKQEREQPKIEYDEKGLFDARNGWKKRPKKK